MAVGAVPTRTKKLGLDGFSRMLKMAYDNGVFFWETADQYGSHPHFKAGLRGLPREKVTIMTKTHASTADEMKADLDRFRKELGTDYIDIMLLHCMMDNNWADKKKGAMEYLTEAQSKGVIKTKGVSCHTLGALKAAARTPGWRWIWRASIPPASPWTPTLAR